MSVKTGEDKLISVCVSVISLTWTACWRAWSASWPPPPSRPLSCPPWGPAALPPPAPSPGWCDLWPAGTPQCPNQSRWSTGHQSWWSWDPVRPAGPWWPAGPLRCRSPCTWQNDSLEEEVNVMVVWGKVLYTHKWMLMKNTFSFYNTKPQNLFNTAQHPWESLITTAKPQNSSGEFESEFSRNILKSNTTTLSFEYLQEIYIRFRELLKQSFMGFQRKFKGKTRI